MEDRSREEDIYIKGAILGQEGERGGEERVGGSGKRGRSGNFDWYYLLSNKKPQ